MSGVFIGPMTFTCEAWSVVGVGPAAVTRGDTTMTLGSLCDLVVIWTGTDVDGWTEGSPRFRCVSCVAG